MEPGDRTAGECPRCGAEIPLDARDGVCPRCAPDHTVLITPELLAESDKMPGHSPPLDETADAVEPQKVPDIGAYEILEMIGRGGMGVVYKARHRGLNQLVALKTLLSGLNASSDLKRRFRREAQVAARLQHPNIVSVYEVGEQDGQMYFTMEYVVGTDLARLSHPQPLRPEEAARYVEAVARAVHYAHEQGVLHRDLKPSNILVRADNCPKITDFGLARQMDSDSSLTMTGDMLGSPGYLPPEQLSAGSGEVGPACDVYGLGGILYYLLTARPPYLSSTVADTLKQLQEMEPVPPRKLNLAVPPDLEVICLKCLRKKQRQRYRTALEVAEDLRHYLEDEPIVARFGGVATPSPQWEAEPEKSSSNLLAGLLLLLLIVGGIVAVAWWHYHSSPPRPPGGSGNTNIFPNQTEPVTNIDNMRIPGSVGQ